MSKQMKNFILIYIFLFSLPGLAEKSPKKPDTPYYSIASVISAIKPSDVSTHHALQIETPPALYHWLSIKSAKRLFERLEKESGRMPLKTLGSNEYPSLLTVNAPAFKDAPGLFAWQNPVGGGIGGSSEVYGNWEALLALKIDPNARIGLVVTSSSENAAPNLSDPRLLKNYDLILHVNGDVLGREFVPGYIEWAIVNPQSVLGYSIDPNESIPVIKEFIAALKAFKAPRKSNLPPLEVIAGPQHNPLITGVLTATDFEKMIASLTLHQAKLGKKNSKGWTSFKSNSRCEGVFLN